MYRICEITAVSEKQSIARTILDDLPAWFGIEEAKQAYINDCAFLHVWAAFEQHEAVGFLGLKKHHENAEVYVMGVLQKYHHQHIGQILMETCKLWCVQNDIAYLQVKTLDESHPDKGYACTRAFYKAMGFVPLETFSDLWDPSNPCVLMIQRLPHSAMHYAAYKEELQLLHTQNRVECDLYTIVASILRETDINHCISMRDVSTRRSSDFSNRYKGAAGFPDFVIRARVPDPSAALCGAVEIKYLWENLNDHMAQVDGHVQSYGAVLYTNGLEWRYYENDTRQWCWQVELGYYDKENDQLQWNEESKWKELLTRLESITWSMKRKGVL